MATKGKLTVGQVDENRSRLHGTLNLEDFADCDLVIEAVIENMEEKLRLFPALDRIVKPEGILLSNTSSLNVTHMGAVTRRPQQVGGLHFFNPAPVLSISCLSHIWLQQFACLKMVRLPGTISITP
jgi:3-hydroxybutyryl-CoA dehydrogenase